MSGGRYDYAGAAKELKCEQSWLRRNIKRLPHSKKGRSVTFSEADLQRIDQLTHHEPSTGPLAVVPGQPKTAGAHPLRHLKPLPSRRTAAGN
jgi:hypothetical protein